MDTWTKIISEIKLRAEAEPTLGSYLYSLILSQKDFLSAVASILASKLNSDALSAKDIRKFLLETYQADLEIQNSILDDLEFVKKQDPACEYLSTPLLFYKGFLGLSCYRAAHHLWNNDRHTLALFLQGRTSEVFGLDIHPAANIAGGVMIDHATGVVIGETSKISSKVSIFQGVTLGGKGTETGKRHPDILEGATIYASSTILGNIKVGKNAIVAAGSLVLKDVKDGETVAGIPARKVKGLISESAEWDPGNSGL